MEQVPIMLRSIAYVSLSISVRFPCIMWRSSTKHRTALSETLLCQSMGYDMAEQVVELPAQQLEVGPPRHRSALEQDSPYRRKGAEVFDHIEYRKRDMIEGIFGAEETKNRQLHCRFTKPANMRRFGKIRGIAWNLKVLNRLRCARELGIPIPLYPDRRASAKPRPRQSPPALMPA